jgi:hypothetical protein
MYFDLVSQNLPEMKIRRLKSKHLFMCDTVDPIWKKYVFNIELLCRRITFLLIDV